MNKRGIFFTLIAIALITLFFLSYTFYSVLTDNSPVRTRVETLNSFVSSVEADLPRQVYITGFRTLVVSQKKIAETGLYLANVNNSIQELFFNGTSAGQPETLMLGATLPELASSLQQKAAKINARLNVSDIHLSAYQDNPWEVVFQVTLDLTLVDEAGLAQWNKTEKVEARVPIEGFEDPLYTVNTQTQVINKIKTTPYTVFVSGTNVTNLVAHATNSWYRASTDAPSYLDRLEGKTTASAYGVESLVNIQKLSAAGVPVTQKSIVDHIYFSAANPQAHRISGTPSWVYIDNAHLADYQASGLAQ